MSKLQYLEFCEELEMGNNKEKTAKYRIVVELQDIREFVKRYKDEPSNYSHHGVDVETRKTSLYLYYDKREEYLKFWEHILDIMDEERKRQEEKEES